MYGLLLQFSCLWNTKEDKPGHLLQVMKEGGKPNGQVTNMYRLCSLSGQSPSHLPLPTSHRMNNELSPHQPRTTSDTQSRGA